MDPVFIARLLHGLAGSALSVDSSSPSGAGVGPSVLPGPSMDSAPRTVSTPASQSPRPLTLPFQYVYYDLTGAETKSTHTSISASTQIATLTKPYRFARLKSLEAVVFPAAHAVKTPVSVDVAWVTADQSPTDKAVLNTFGAQRITVGNFTTSTFPIVPADLTMLNPIIKDSITYLDTPRLALNFYKVDGADSTKISASVVIRGELELSSPLPIALPA
jgi:hypothetical protein